MDWIWLDFDRTCRCIRMNWIELNYLEKRDFGSISDALQFLDVVREFLPEHIGSFFVNELALARIVGRYQIFVQKTWLQYKLLDHSFKSATLANFKSTIKRLAVISLGNRWCRAQRKAIQSNSQYYDFRILPHRARLGRKFLEREAMAKKHDCPFCWNLKNWNRKSQVGCVVGNLRRKLLLERQSRSRLYATDERIRMRASSPILLKLWSSPVRFIFTTLIPISIQNY